MEHALQHPVWSRIRESRLWSLVLNVICSLTFYHLIALPPHLQAVLSLAHLYYFFEEHRQHYPVHKTIRHYKDVVTLHMDMYKPDHYLWERLEKRPSRALHLDAIRGIAALVILFFHMNQYGTLSKPFQKHFVDNRSILFYLANDGYIAVQLFVVLSGYVLARVYWTEKRAKMLYRLLAGRVARFYPLHWLTAIVYFCINAYQINVFQKWNQPHLSSAKFLRCLSLTGFWTYKHDPALVHVCNGVSWSLSAEWLWNIAMFVCIRFFSFHWNLLIFEALCYLGYFSMYRGMGKLGGSYTFEMLYPFFMGVLVHQVLGRVQLNRRIFLIMGDLSFLYLLLAMGTFLNRDRYGQYSTDKAWTNLYMPSYAVYLILALENSLLFRRLLSSRPFTFLGSISFALYLSHGSVLMFLNVQIQRGIAPPIDSLFAVLVVYLVAIQVAAILHEVFEQRAKLYFDAVLTRSQRPKQAI